MSSRLHGIDWLRVLAVLLVFFAHVAHIFDFDLEGSIKNAETSLVASVYMFFVMQWVMPLFFLLAGVSSWFSLRSRSGKQYLNERVQRLLIPLLFGSVALIPWNGYMSALNHATFEGSFWQYIPVHFERTWESLQTPQVHHGLVLLYYTSWHLWFLGYLLIFSACALPLFRSGARMARFAALCDRRMGLLAFAVPIAVIKVVLAPRFPAYADWSDTLVWFTVFTYGWLFTTDARFFRVVQRQALAWLAVGCVSFALLLGTYALGYLPEWLAHPGYSLDYTLYQMLAALNLWAWVLAIVGCGLRWLNFENAALRYAGEAVLPFYILHQVAVFTTGVIVVEWSVGISTKALVISSVAFAATMLTYEILIRRSRLLQVAFGLKAAAPAVPAFGRDLPRRAADPVLTPGRSDHPTAPPGRLG